MPNVVSGLPDGSPESKKEWGRYRYPGDTRNMKCHDVFCCIVFLILFAAFIALLAYGIIFGSIFKIFNSWDDQGQYCGFDNTLLMDEILIPNSSHFMLKDLTLFPNAFYRASNISVFKCVSVCPIEGSIFEVLAAEAKDTILSNNFSSCPNGTVTDIDNNFVGCSYRTFSLLNRCIPVVLNGSEINVSQFISGFNEIINSIPALSSTVSSVYQLWPIMLAFCGGSVVVAFIWVCILRFLTGPIVYIVVFLVPAILIFVSYLFFFQADDATVIQKIGEQGLSPSQITAIVIFVIALILLLIITFLFKKLKVAIAIIKIAAKALGGNFLILFIPVISLVLLVAFWAGILVSSAFNYSASKLVFRDDRISLDVSRTTQYLIIYNIIYVVFITVFIYFSNYYAMSNAIVSWYFSNRVGCGLGCRCWLGYFYAFTKACGTITCTALIMTPLYLFIIAMQYLEFKSKQQNASYIIRFLIKCCKCCLLCFEKFIRYLNKTLLTIQQIFNKNWFRSARLVVDVILSDIITTTLLNGVTFFIIFLSKLVVAGIAAGGFYIYIRVVLNNIAGWLFPTFVVFIVSYFISSFILSAYDNVIDVVFVCMQSQFSIPGCDLDPNSDLAKNIKRIQELQNAGTTKKVSAE